MITTTPPRRRQFLPMAVASALGASLGLSAVPVFALSGEAPVLLFDLDLPAQPLSSSLGALSRQSGVQVFAESNLVAGRAAPAIKGRLSLAEALDRVLAGSGLGASVLNSGLFVVRRLAVSDESAVTLSTVTVVGDRPEQGFKADTQSSATKFGLSLRETPQSVSVITQDSLKARQVFDFGQALELSAGVNQYTGNGPFAGQPSFGSNDVSIRGLTLDALNDIREDGFVNPTYYATPDLAIYDRIEVVKGPSSVIYGRGSAGGVINRIRKKPLADGQIDLEVSAGSFDTWRGDLDVTGPLFSSDRIRGRLIAAYEDSGAFVDGVNSRRTVISPSLGVDLTSSTRLLLQGLYQNDSFIPNTGFPLVPQGGDLFAAPNIPRSLYVGVPTEKRNQWDIYTGNAQLDQKLGGDWLATLRFNASRVNSPIQADRYAYGFAVGDDPETEEVERRGDTQLVRNDFAVDRDIWAGELQLSGSFDLAGRKVKVVTGFEHSDNDYHRAGAYAYLGTANIYDGNFGDLPDQDVTPGFEFNTHDRIDGFYAQAQGRPIERLSVLLGLRYDSVKSVFDDRTTPSLSKKKDGAVTGRIGLTYDLSQQVSVYSLYARSFSPVNSEVDQNGDILEPETGKIYEAGLKTEFFDRRLSVTSAVFRIDRTRIPVSVPVGPGDAPYSISSGLQRSDGFELEANGQPLPGWDLSFAFSRLNSRFKDPDDPFFGAKPGGAANWQLSAFSSYELQAGPLKGLGLGGTVYAIADRGLSSFDRGTLNGFHRVDLNLFYKGLKTWEFALLLRNLLDARYVEGADRTAGYAQFGSPTAALLTVRKRFGK